MAIMAIGANAQTTVDFTSVELSDFTIGTGWELSADGAQIDYTVGGGTEASISYKELTITYKNGNAKKGFIKKNSQGVYANGKNSVIQIKTPSANQSVDFVMSAKGTSGGPEFTLNNGTINGEFPTFSLEKDADDKFTMSTFTITSDADGIINMKETNNGYTLQSYTIKALSGINELSAAKANVNAPVYNLAGQRVNKDAKGILIQNGKKFINK